MSVSDNYRVQILCESRRSPVLAHCRAGFIAKNLIGFFRPLWHSARTFLKKVKEKVKAPLRLIAARSLEVYEYFRGSDRPRLFAVLEKLECGHIYSSLLWDYLDLLNAYTTNPEVSARRRRCHPCAQLVKKPVQSVSAYVKKTGVA